jgi:hypothetical protein
VGDDYRFESEIACFCTPDYRAPARITVRGGAIAEVARLADGGVVPPADWEGQYRTVDGVFDLIEAALKGDAARVDVDYDSRYGYPTDVYIDRDELAADEELGLRLRGLEILP